MLKLRLKKLGRKRQPIYKLVIILNNTKRDGKNIESVGFYNPLTKDFFFEKEKIIFWLKKGIQPTKTVKNLLLKHNLIINFC
jgi:small subunit ribosomal protein S16